MNIWPGVHFISFEFNFSRIWRGLVFSWVCTIRGRSHIAPKNAWKTLGALLSPFFQSAPEAFVVAKQPSAALPVTRRKFRHMTCGALAAFWKVEMFLSRCSADAPGKNERVAPRARRTATASLPLWARIPRVYIWNNELKRAKDAICERPLKTPVLSVCIFLVILAPVSSSAHYLLQLFPLSDFFFTQ